MPAVMGSREDFQLPFFLFAAEVWSNRGQVFKTGGKSVSHFQSFTLGATSFGRSPLVPIPEPEGAVAANDGSTRSVDPPEVSVRELRRDVS